MISEQCVLPNVTSTTLPDSGRMLATIYSNDEIVYMFWFKDGAMYSASLKVYGVDSIDIQIMGDKHKAGNHDST